LLLKESVLSRPIYRAIHRIISYSGITLLSGLTLLAGTWTLQAQDQTGTQAGTQSSSDSKLPPPPTIDANVNRNLTLADVRYDNKYDVYGGIGSYHANAGYQLIGGANLGGFDVQGTRWFTPHIGATVNVRGDYGTIGVAPNDHDIKGPFIMEHTGLAGVSYRLKQGKPAALVLHGLFGADYGVFNHALDGVPPAVFGLFNNQTSFAMALGGSLDLNRSPQLAFRISPDYVYTDFGGIAQNEFAISVGILYRLKFPKGAFKQRPQ
jgi:hypothetical protein